MNQGHAPAKQCIRAARATSLGEPLSGAERAFLKQACHFERLATATTADEPTVTHDNDEYQQSLDIYSSALASPSGERLRTLNGIYLASWKLERIQ